jgi:hypothetical protein
MSIVYFNSDVNGDATIDEDFGSDAALRVQEHDISPVSMQFTGKGGP